MRIAIIGGTGIGERLIQRMEPSGIELHRPDTPFGWPSAEIVRGTIRPNGAGGGGGSGGGPVDVLLLNRHGLGHKIPPHALPYRANIYALKELGATHIIATGATGSLREEIRPGDLVLCDQVIDRTYQRARTFFDSAAVHVEFADPFCSAMRSWLLDAAGAAGTTVHERGTYVCIEGPSFSTRAESRLYRQTGGDLVGMTAMPEAKLAREAELPYVLLALPTDYDSWREPAAAVSGDSVLASIHENLARCANAALKLIDHALSSADRLAAQQCAAHTALEHAIWTERDKIRPGEIDRLEPIWARALAELEAQDRLKPTRVG